MNWLNWIPSGASCCVQERIQKPELKGYLHKTDSSADIISAVYPQLPLSQDGRDRALISPQMILM